MDSVLEKLVLSPKLSFFYNELTAFLETEKAKRERFYETMTEQKKMEFINGEIVVQSPVKIEHNIVGKLLLKLLDTYVSQRKLGFVGYEKILVVLSRNDYEPDICFFRKEKSQKFTQGQMKFPSPDFVVEILSPSTESIDRKVKFEDYAAHGVGEYWIIEPEKQFVEQYLLENQTFSLKIKSDSGEIRSTIVEGFSIPIRSIFGESENMISLREILNNPKNNVE